MKQVELQSIHKVIQQKADDLMRALQQLVGNQPAGLLAVQAYEANRRFEDFMARVNNCAILVQARTDENVEKIVDEAMEQDKVIPFPGTNAPAAEEEAAPSAE